MYADDLPTLALRFDKPAAIKYKLRNHDFPIPLRCRGLFLLWGDWGERKTEDAESSPARFLFLGCPVGASAKRRVAIPRFNTVSFGKHSLMYMGPKVWSSVPCNVKEASIP